MTDSELIKKSKLTAEQFITENSRLKNPTVIKEVSNLMISFAKMHSKLALFYASEKAMVSPELRDFIEDSWEFGNRIDKQSILNAYPKENIK